MATKIVKCNCKHSYQDEKYGKGMRVAAKLATGKSSTPKFRCTVCLAEQGSSEPEKEEKKK